MVGGARWARDLRRLAVGAVVAGAVSAAARAGEAPRRSGDWFVGEPGNLCLAIREADGARLTLALTRWDDLSDAVLFWRPGLPPLWSDPAEGWSTGLTQEAEDASAEANFHLELRVDGALVPLFPNTWMTQEPDQPGPTYRLGLEQQPLISALERGTLLEVVRAGEVLGAFPIAGSGRVARRLARCVAREPR